MSVRAAALSAILFAWGLQGAPALAAGSAGAGASTQAYVQANLRLVTTAAGRIPRGESIIDGVLAQVRRECPLAAGGSPQDPESTELSNEVIGTMVTAAIHPILGSIREYLRAVSRLRWGSRRANSEVQGYVSRLRAMAGLAQPPLCADVRSWAASGYKQLPSSTVAFDDVFVPDWVAIGELPPALSAFEGGGVRALARRSSQREAELTDFEAREVENWGRIMNALELNP